MCPIDLKAVDAEKLNSDEKEWLNSYHATVYEKLNEHLNTEEKKWLKNQTRLVD
jgi:Xaa-Pro aminopeptidase